MKASRRDPCEVIELAEDIADKELWDAVVREPMAEIVAGQGEKNMKEPET